MKGRRAIRAQILVGSALIALHGSIASAQVSRVVPIVLDVDNGSAHYATELTLTNDEPTATSVAMTYTPSMGSREGAGTVNETLGAGEQRRIPDVLAYLRGKGLEIPSPSAEPSQGGTLRLAFTGVAVDASHLTALARTTAATAPPLPVGRAGFAYAAPLVTGVSGSAVVGGLRSNETDRSNLAIANFSDLPATFRVAVEDLTPDTPHGFRLVVVRDNQVLPPWGWIQVNSSELLDAAGIRDGVALVTGSGSLYIYGVINDRVTNDASFLTPNGSPAGFIPAVVETAGFVTELTFWNEGMHTTPFSLDYVESLSPQKGPGGRYAFLQGTFRQEIVPNAIDMLRQKPSIVIGPAGAADYAGVLWVASAFASSPSSRTLTRPLDPGGGRFGFSAAPVRLSDAAADRAAVYGLLSDDENRTNVAVLSIGDPLVDGPVTLRLQVHDGRAGGAPRGDPVTVMLAPRQWKQLNGILRTASVTDGWVEITRLSGTAPWYAYGVINDGAYPGERTGDGSYVAMTK